MKGTGETPWWNLEDLHVESGRIPEDPGNESEKTPGSNLGELLEEYWEDAWKKFRKVMGKSHEIYGEHLELLLEGVWKHSWTGSGMILVKTFGKTSKQNLGPFFEGLRQDSW